MIVFPRTVEPKLGDDFLSPAPLIQLFNFHVGSTEKNCHLYTRFVTPHRVIKNGSKIGTPFAATTSGGPL